jgi:fumarate reductase flavoprotein subunit
MAEATGDQPDLIVAGAGGGLVAALRGAQRGLDVLVVEASEYFLQSSNTAMSTAMVPAAGTRWQLEAGIDDSPDTFVADIMHKTHNEADPVLARALAEVSAELVTWLADDIGLPLSLVTDFPYPGHSQFRCHTVPGRSGRTMLAGLDEALRRFPNVTVLRPAKLVDVEMDDSGVSGVRVSFPDGQTEQIPTHALVLATNGFGANPELVRRYLPEIADAVYHGSPESTGDALRIGTALGADTAFLDAYQGHAALAVPAATLAGWATVMHGGILVDMQGDRFGDETIGYSEYAREEVEHANSRAVIVIDQRIHDACLAFTDFVDTVESGALRWGDTPAELAAAMRVDVDGLTATIAEVTDLARGQGSDRFGRSLWEAPLQPPYAGIAVAPALFHTQGGLRVDGSARVLRSDNTVITGLYAAGGAAMGISGHGAGGYLAGNGLLPALGLAYLAAGDVAATLSR